MRQFVASLGCAMLACAAARAQKLPLPGQPERILQLLDVQALVTTGDQRADKPDTMGKRLRDLAEFARAFMDPPLGEGDDVQPLGNRYLAVLAQPRQAAGLEQLIQTAAKEQDRAVAVAIELLEVPKAAAEEHLLPLFTQTKEASSKTPLRAVLTKEPLEKALATLHSAKGTVQLTAPRLAVRPLQIGTLSAGKEITYMKDFEVTATADGNIADPVVGRVFDGTEVRVAVAPMPDRTLAVHCEVTLQKVQQPIPEFETRLGSVPITIQLPTVRSTRFDQKVIQPDGGGTLLASPRGDGSWLCAVVRAGFTDGAQEEPARK